ncbi:hypothetical protein M3Y97_00115400 [Aphelenchoides bicaudatus]|nr:hypothetical protein M3Y97_00115400 [Aphelenchoides bicaudatus]
MIADLQFVLLLVICIVPFIKTYADVTDITLPRISKFDESRVVVGTQERYLNRFRPCTGKLDFCETICPTYCDYYSDEHRFTSCNCTECFCFCESNKQLESRDADGLLKCYPYIKPLIKPASSADGSNVSDKAAELMTKVQSITETSPWYCYT